VTLTSFPYFLIQNPARVSNPREKITRATFSLHWVPGHELIKGNERANELAQQATEANSLMPNAANNVPIPAIFARAKIMDFKPKHKEFYGATTRKHLQKIDKALPGKHANKLYNALNRKAAATLVQLRTNISRLNTYLSKIRRCRHRQVRTRNEGNSTTLLTSVSKMKKREGGYEGSAYSSPFHARNAS
jgi:hypothetical protein